MSFCLKSSLFVFLIILTGCFGSLKKPDTVDKDYLNKQKQAEKAKTEITAAVDKVEKKGSVLVHGADYALNLETNKTPPVQVASELISYAKLTLDRVPVDEARKIEDIVDGLIKEVRAENLKLKIQNTTNKVEIDALRGQLKLVESEGNAARQKMTTFQNEIIRLQNNEELLRKKYEVELGKLEKQNLDNAAKAAAWDDDHTLLSSLNPFKDIASLFKKLFTLSVIGGILFVGFKVLEVFFPALSILSGIGSMCIGIVKKILPGAIKGAGLVSGQALEALKHVVQSNYSFMKTLKDKPIEDDLIEKYPDNYNFTKKEVKELLLALTDKTLEELEKELSKNTDETSRGFITTVKQEIKGEKPVTSLI